MKIINKKTIATLFSLAVFILPTIVYGANLIPCGNVKVDNVVTDMCTFDDLIRLANSIIRFLMYDVAVPLAALGFMYSGARLVLFQKKEGEWTSAKERFWDVAMGFGYMLGAYVLIKTVLFWFLSNDQIDFMKFMLDVTQ